MNNTKRQKQKLEAARRAKRKMIQPEHGRKHYRRSTRDVKPAARHCVEAEVSVDTGRGAERSEETVGDCGL